VIVGKSKKNAFDLDQDDKSCFIVDMFNRIIIHHALWFNEVKHQMGMEKALQALETATEKSLSIQIKRLSQVLDFELKDGLPASLVNMNEETQTALMRAMAKNWLVNDGVWFQAVEFNRGMIDAKRCNDSCWAQFSPYEAWAVKKFLNLPDAPGLEGLKQALNFRMYAMINKQSIIDDERPDSFVFQMNDCRVQSARKRKNLADYPCKSGGVVEYTYFARAIDPRIITECIRCPPDEHPEECYCAWRFSIER
jgi:hypothetical protein